MSEFEGKEREWFIAEHVKMKARVERLEKVAETVPELLRLVDDLMPGIRHLALQNYKRVNDAPLAATQALAALGEK